MIYCEDCGRPLMGSSGHGTKGVHRYYTHKLIRGEPIICSVKTIRAEEIEQAVFKHMDEILFRDGYFDALEKRFDTALKRTCQDQKISEKQHGNELEKLEREIHATIRLASEMKSDVGIEEMLKTTLTRLKNEKEKLEKFLRETKEASGGSDGDAKEARQLLELNLAEYKKAKSKATASMLKRLLHKIFSGIVIGSEGAKLSYPTTGVKSHLGRIDQCGRVPDEQSGATGLLPFSKRRLVKIQDFTNVPPLPA